MWMQGRQMNSASTQMNFVWIPALQEWPRPPLTGLLEAVGRAAKLLLVLLYEVALFQEMK